jgi:hypothetical protein
MDKETSKKFGIVLYFLQKNVINNKSWNEFLESIDVSDSDWHEIRLHLETTYGIKTYV